MQGSAEFDLIFERHSRAIFGFLYRMTGNRASAEDLVQEVFAQLAKTNGSVPAERVEGWLYRTARYRALDYKRKIRRDNGAREFLAAGIREAYTPAEDGDVEAIRKAVTELPEKTRAVVVLYYLEEKKAKEVAELLEMPVSTVWTHIGRGLDKLAEIAERMGLTDELH